MTLKQAMTTTHALAMPNFNEFFTIETNVVGERIGAILTQQGKPVAFMSRALELQKNHGQPTSKKCSQLWRLYAYGDHIYWRGSSSSKSINTT